MSSSFPTLFSARPSTGISTEDPLVSFFYEKRRTEAPYSLLFLEEDQRLSPTQQFSLRALCPLNSLSSSSLPAPTLTLHFSNHANYEWVQEKLAEQHVVMGGRHCTSPQTACFQSSRALHVLFSLLKQELPLPSNLTKTLEAIAATLPPLDEEAAPLAPTHSSPSSSGFHPSFFGRYSRDLSLQLELLEAEQTSELELDYLTLGSQEGLMSWNASYSFRFPGPPSCNLFFSDERAANRFRDRAHEDGLTLPQADLFDAIHLEGEEPVTWALSFLQSHGSFLESERAEIPNFLRSIQPHIKTLKPPSPLLVS